MVGDPNALARRPRTARTMRARPAADRAAFCGLRGASAQVGAASGSRPGKRSA
jgi:hypothetical protein